MCSIRAQERLPGFRVLHIGGQSSTETSQKENTHQPFCIFVIRGTFQLSREGLTCHLAPVTKN